MTSIASSPARAMARDWNEPENASAESAPAGSGPATLLTLSRRGCRCVVSGEGAGALFCNAPAEAGSSWCAEHRARFNEAPPKRLTVQDAEARATAGRRLLLGRVLARRKLIQEAKR